MSDELTLTQNARLVIGGQQRLLIAQTQSLDVGSAALVDETVSVGTSEEVLPFGDLASLGEFWIMNLDETNYVTWGPEVAGAMAAPAFTLPPKVAGEVPFVAGPVNLTAAAVIRAKANTAACLVRFIVLSE